MSEQEGRLYAENIPPDKLEAEDISTSGGTDMDELQDTKDSDGVIKEEFDVDLDKEDYVETNVNKEELTIAENGEEKTSKEIDNEDEKDDKDCVKDDSDKENQNEEIVSNSYCEDKVEDTKVDSPSSERENMEECDNEKKDRAKDETSPIKDDVGIGQSKSRSSSPHPTSVRLRKRHSHNSPDRRKSGSAPARDEESKRVKQEAIEDSVCGGGDVETLRQLAISREGLVNDELRQRAWPALLGVDVHNIPPCPDQVTLKSHRDYNQVVLDVNRSIKRFPPGMDEEVRLGYQDQLVDTIMRVLVHHDHLHYYQGYHDVVVTFLLVVGEDLTFALMDQLSTKHLREFMYKTMDQTNQMLNYLYPIIARASPKLEAFMTDAETGTIFCLPWLITWYGHVLNDFKHIVRLYDFFIASDPLMPIYLAAAIVLHREEEILCLEAEMPIIHSLLSRIPSDLPMEKLITYAGDLFVQFPPHSLAEEASKHKQREEDKRLANQRLAAEARALREKHRQARLAASKPRSRTNPFSWLVSSGGSNRSVMMRVTVWTVVAGVTAAVVAAWLARSTGRGEGEQGDHGGSWGVWGW